jgi:hypothetical protein
MTNMENNLWFHKFSKNKTSQHGEDGIIAEIFLQIGTKNKFVVECGAADGVKNSNTYTIVSKQQWGGLLIEGDPTIYETLKRNYGPFPSAKCINSFISFTGKTSFDEIFKVYQVPKDFDLFILDIDGNEFHVWEAIKEFKPRVVVVEFNQSIPNEVDFVQPKDMSIQQGSSLRALARLGGTLGYRLVAVTDINAFFVEKNNAKPFESFNNSLDTIRPHNPYETKLFQLYDGTLKISGNRELLWHRLEIDEEKLQVLPRSKRVYMNGINSNDFIRKVKYRARKSPFYPLIKKVRRVPFFKKIIQ